MKIVQTFWTGGRSLLNNGFGWINPQYNLMSWALSCLSLKEHYENVVLYTDSNGYKVLVELLGLPYSDVIIQYDNLVCPEPHWAYPKIVTYSLQNEPFIHVDGDVYLLDKLSHDVEMSGLIAQNLETGYGYYKSMMNDLLRRGMLLPTFLKGELEKDSIMAYNAGILGGNDLEFIQEYCQAAFHIIESNQLNDENSRKVTITNNLLFEQNLFYAFSKLRNKTVTTVLDYNAFDNVYTYEKFCDFYNYKNTRFMHILGAHKKSKQICELLGKTLMNKYPDFYKKILELFPCNHKRLQSKNGYIITPNLSSQMCVATYHDYLNGLSSKWEKISYEDLYNQEKCLSVYIDFLNTSEEFEKSYVLCKNPYLSIFEIPKHWPFEVKSLLKNRINKDIECADFDIACIPCLLDKGFKEVLINNLCYNIFTLLEEEKTINSLTNELFPYFTSEITEDQVKKLIMEQLEYLFYYGLIYVRLV